jgi:hypothetical protein
MYQNRIIPRYKITSSNTKGEARQGAGRRRSPQRQLERYYGYWFDESRSLEIIRALWL